MADDACLIIIPDSQPAVGAPVPAVGPLECLTTPAVRAWLQAHGVSASSHRVRILPPEAGAAIPEQAERLPVPLSAAEGETVRLACLPQARAAVEGELRNLGRLAEGAEDLVVRALAHGVPAHRVVELTGLDPAAVEQAHRTVFGTAADA
ncbi:DUF6003 family protein [Streptomyces sp. NPDC018031]|uniref:DUF6003 family protein n=1 Tax=Streptomyces sp. NPDC018031 TaxID=3365033 RepID=UPI003798E6A9